MSSGKTPTGDRPFGYDFKGEDMDTFDPNSFSAPYYPPPGPPLLDNNESDLLRSFFDNPNDVDPTSLSMPSDFQGQGVGVYGDMNFDWMENGVQGFGSTSRSLQNPGTVGTSQRFPSSNNLFSNMNGQQGSLQATDDVYAAARLLHDNQARSNGQMFAMSNPAAGMGPGAAYNHPSASSAPYDLTSPAVMNGMHNLQLGHSGKQDSVGFVPNLDTEVNGWTGEPRTGPLRFGSDNNFRPGTYLPPPTEAPDKELTEAVAQHFQYNRELQSRSGPSEPTSPLDTPKKRGRPPLTSNRSRSSDDEDQSSEQGDATQKKRRKSMIQGVDPDDGEDDGFTGSRSKNRKQRRQSKSKVQPQPERPSLQKRQKSSDAGNKATRENLTEEQKRSNHIQSEQKRRNLIKQGFEDLNMLVPELRAGGFSKSNMLLEVARFMRTLQEGNDELKALIESMDNG